MKSDRSWYSTPDRDVCHFDVQTLAVRHIIGFGKDSSSTPLVFGSDGLVAYLTGCFVTFYDLRTNCQVQHLALESRRRAFSCLAISEDANLLAAGEQGQDPSVVLWWLDQGTRRRPVELKGHKDTITAISFSPNGQYLASVGNTLDSKLILWDCQMETVLCSQLIHIQANLTCLSFSMDSKTLYTSGESHFTMWSLSQKPGRGGSSVSLTPKAALPSSDKVVGVVDVKASPTKKSSFMFAVSKNGTLYKLRLQKGGLTIEKKTDLRVSQAFSLTVGANKIAVSCANGVVKIIKAKSLTLETTITKPAGDSECSSLASRTSDINFEAGLNWGFVRFDASSDALYCAFDSSSSSLAVVYADHTVAFWDSEDTAQIQCYHTLKSPSGCTTDIFSVPSQSSDRKSLDRTSVKAMRSPNIHNPQAVESEFATCSDKGMIHVWNLKMQTVQPRQQAYISHDAERLGCPNSARVEVCMQTIDVNPRAAIKKPALARRSKDVLSGVKPAKDGKKSKQSKSAAAETRPKRITAKKTTTTAGPSTRKAAIPKKKAPTIRQMSSVRPTQKGKRVVGTPGPMRLSTELTDKALLTAPVVAVHKPGPSKGSCGEIEGSSTTSTEAVHLTCLRTSPDSLHLVVGDSKGSVRIYHSPSMKMLVKKELHSSPITAIEFSLPGKHGEILLATGAQDGTVSVIEVDNDFKIKLEKEDHSEPVTGLSFSPEGKAIVSCGRDNYLYYESLTQVDLDCEEEDLELFLARHYLMQSTFEAMHFNAARNTYMLACSDNFIRVFNSMGQYVHAIQIPEDLGAPTKIIQGPLSSMIITCHENNRVAVFEYFTGRLLAVGEGHSKLTGALLINNGRNLVTTGEDGLLVVWELHEDLRRRCLAAPAERGMPTTESGYANEFFYQLQKEKERAARAVSDPCRPTQVSSGGAQTGGMTLFGQSTLSGTTPMGSRPASRLSGMSLPLESPVAQSSQPISIPSKEHARLPSWWSKNDGMSDDGLLDDFESRSPSVYSRPPKLDLGHISDTDDESVPIPMHLNRSHTLMNSHFSDLDSIPVDHFVAGPGYSRRGLSFENDRYHRPMDSFNRGRRSNESFSGSPAYGFHPCSSLAQYQDERSDAARSRGPFPYCDRAFGRPTGPEPPSSVSCASDSRTSTPFSIHPRSGCDADAMMSNLIGDGNDEQFALSRRSPYSTYGPIGPNIRRIASRTPQSMYSDDKTVYSRPNSEEHTKKMFSEFRPPSSDESLAPMQSPFQRLGSPFTWTQNQIEGETIEEYVCESDDETVVPCDEFIEEEEGRVLTSHVRVCSKNPLYSHRSVTSDLAHHRTRSVMPSGESLKDLYSLEQVASFTDMGGEVESEECEFDKSSSPVRKSTDLILSAVLESVSKSLCKLKENIGLHESLAECQLPTYRKQECVDSVKQELVALLEKKIQG